jgi:hypothetical protein
MKPAACLALLLVLASPVVQAAPARLPAAEVVEVIAADQDRRVIAALERIEGTGRRLLALRAYLRADAQLVRRWSWTAEEIASFSGSPEDRAMQADIARVQQAFAAANPGFELWVNPEVRSLDTQLSNWNRNESVARAAARVLAAIDAWLESPAVRSMPPADMARAAEKFLAGHAPSPIPTLAAPGLSPHGQMRAVDFQVTRGGRIIAGPVSATLGAAWDAAGWTARLKAAVLAAGGRFTGPLIAPREPWHYSYTPAPAPAPVARR